eukprot:CAMPEP_0202835556 /NCGR_PEP_ID=MMETSP1389-20130828/37061_1 /ASSEMBLY_ACC=CAM_ASM_000865 /TAXON_ID=302021 /ORGANISM="Rhodomonas sp., Strain CCMP768" /LENGTH=75 /DNA_ID=CAMNT_0049511091 /DNA_START=161 /DNA_END=388 /DNA_ORIENTATION=+
MISLLRPMMMLVRGDHGCSDCFDEPEPVVGWDLGFPDVTNPTFKVAAYDWQWTEGGRDDYCPECFDYPSQLPAGY